MENVPVDAGPVEAGEDGGDLAPAAVTAVRSTNPWTDIPVRVALRVAERRGVDATELRPLSEAVNPDALEVLFTDGVSHSAIGSISFEYEGFDVTVEKHGPDVEITLVALEA